MLCWQTRRAWGITQLVVWPFLANLGGQIIRRSDLSIEPSAESPSSFHMPSGSANIFGQAQDKGVRKAGVAKHPCHLGEKGFKLRPGTLLKAAALHALRQLYAILRHLMQALHVKNYNPIPTFNSTTYKKKHPAHFNITLQDLPNPLRKEIIACCGLDWRMAVENQAPADKNHKKADFNQKTFKFQGVSQARFPGAHCRQAAPNQH